MTHEEEVDKYVEKYSKGFDPVLTRRLVNDALNFLNEREPEWGLEKPINRDTYMRELMRKRAK